jgi:hypothetical protein
LKSGKSIAQTIAAWRQATKPLRGLRFYDLRHQAITELAAAGVPEAPDNGLSAAYLARCWNIAATFEWLQNVKQ